jgi:hypothetical protein
MVSIGVWIARGLLMLSSLVGCGGVSPSASPLSTPFFLPTAEDTTRLAMVRHELDTRALHCVEALGCQQVHFARALVSLFENQEAARASFRRVIDQSPASPLAASSKLWLRLIGDNGNPGTSSDAPQNPVTDIAAEFVRDWMERQLAELRDKPVALTPAQESIEEQSRLVQVLQKQVRERDRRIAVLRSQLEALKLIDQDHEERKRTLKVPATLLPGDTHR